MEKRSISGTELSNNQYESVRDDLDQNNNSIVYMDGELDPNT